MAWILRVADRPRSERSPVSNGLLDEAIRADLATVQESFSPVDDCRVHAIDQRQELDERGLIPGAETAKAYLFIGHGTMSFRGHLLRCIDADRRP
jgi:hypothetical protein